MRIVVISMIRDAWGGSEMLWYEMAVEALQKGHEVIHVAFETPEKAARISELEKLGLKRILRPGWIPPGAGTTGRFYHLGKNYLRKKIKSPINAAFKLNPDIVLYNGTCYSVGNEKELLSNLGRSSMPFFIIGHLNHGLLRGISEPVADKVRWAYKRARKVFFVSERSIQTAQRHLCTILPNAEVIRNPVNLQQTSPLPFPSLHGAIHLASVANLVTEHKGQDLLLEALAQWTEKEWKLSICGTGADLDYLRNLAEFYGISDRVTFHGNVSNIRKLWETNHILVMPSHMEGMPLAVVEAMLCGRICLATDVGGHSEWIRDNSNGFLIPAPTVSFILQTLDRALEKKKDWEAMGLQAHQAAAALYDPNAGSTLLNRIIAP